jgi:hypothetical protein
VAPPADDRGGGAARAAGAEGGAAPAPVRGEMHAAPPFLSWRAIYAIVLGALAGQVALYAALTALYR